MKKQSKPSPATVARILKSLPRSGDGKFIYPGAKLVRIVRRSAVKEVIGETCEVKAVGTNATVYTKSSDGTLRVRYWNSRLSIVPRASSLLVDVEEARVLYDRHLICFLRQTGRISHKYLITPAGRAAVEGAVADKFLKSRRENAGLPRRASEL